MFVTLRGAMKMNEAVAFWAYFRKWVPERRWTFWYGNWKWRKCDWVLLLASEFTFGILLRIQENVRLTVRFVLRCPFLCCICCLAIKVGNEFYWSFERYKNNDQDDYCNWPTNSIYIWSYIIFYDIWTLLIILKCMIIFIRVFSNIVTNHLNNNIKVKSIKVKLGTEGSRGRGSWFLLKRISHKLISFVIFA